MTECVRAKIGIIMCAYNSEKTIIDSIKSIIYQEFSDWHLLIIDDGSDKPLEHFLLEHGIIDDRMTVIRQQNLGLGVSRNKGVDFFIDTPVEYLSLLDTDDIWHPQKLALQVSILQTNSKTTAVVTTNQIIDNKIAYEDCNFERVDEETVRFELHKDLAGKLLDGGFFFCPASIMFKRDQAYKFRYHAWRGGEDLLAFLRLSLGGGPIAKMETPVYLERTLASSMQRSPETNFRASYTYIDTINTLLNEGIVPAELINQAYRARDKFIQGLFWNGKNLLGLKKFIRVLRENFGKIHYPKTKLVVALKCLYYVLFLTINRKKHEDTISPL